MSKDPTVFIFMRFCNIITSIFRNLLTKSRLLEWAMVTSSVYMATPLFLYESLSHLKKFEKKGWFSRVFFFTMSPQNVFLESRHTISFEPNLFKWKVKCELTTRPMGTRFRLVLLHLNQLRLLPSQLVHIYMAIYVKTQPKRGNPGKSTLCLRSFDLASKRINKWVKHDFAGIKRQESKSLMS